MSVIVAAKRGGERKSAKKKEKKKKGGNRYRIPTMDINERNVPENSVPYCARLRDERKGRWLLRPSPLNTRCVTRIVTILRICDQHPHHCDIVALGTRFIRYSYYYQQDLE